MKKLLSTLVLVVLGLSAQAQTVTLNAESGNRSIDAANCWVFGAQTFTNTAPFVINGTWSVYSNQLTSLLPSHSWIKSPWIKLAAGNITFQTRLNGTPGTTRGIRVYYMPVDESNVNHREGAIQQIYSYDYASPTDVTVRSHSIAVPANLVGGVYKIYFSWIGTGGTGRISSDLFSIPGEYWALPAVNCWPKALILDRDGDNVPDADDEFPDDNKRAFTSYYPAKNVFGTLMFEDLWPSRGDYDFNDIVVNYNIVHVLNAQNKVVESKIKSVLKATGGSYQNGFAIQYKGLANNKVVSVTGQVKTGSVFNVASNGAEANVTNGASILIFDNAYRVLKPQPGVGINTSLGAPKSPVDTQTVVVSYRTALGAAAPGGDVVLADVAADKFNPFIVVNQVRTVEVHLTDMAPTNLMNPAGFNTKDDKSNPGTGKYYRTEGNLPWALNIPEEVPYMVEKIDFTKGYLKLIDWALSGGTQFTDWYKNNSGNRDADMFYR